MNSDTNIMWSPDELLFRNFAELKSLKCDDEKVPTITSREQVSNQFSAMCNKTDNTTNPNDLQQKTEESVEKCFDRFEKNRFLNRRLMQLNRVEHHKYLETMLRNLPTHYQCLDSSRPWCIYWILQSAQLLSFTFDTETLDSVVQFLCK